MLNAASVVGVTYIVLRVRVALNHRKPSYHHEKGHLIVTPPKSKTKPRSSLDWNV